MDLLETHSSGNHPMCPQVSHHNLSQLLIQASETDMQHSYFLSFQIFRVSAYGLNKFLFFLFFYAGPLLTEC